MSSPLSVEFADLASGVRGWIGAGAPGLGPDEVAALIFDGDAELIAERGGDATVSPNGEQVTAEARSGGIEVKVVVTAATKAGPLSAGRAKVELLKDGSRRSLACAGAFDALADGAGAEGGLLRTIVALRDDGSSLALRSFRPAGANEHGAEETEAWVLEPEQQQQQQQQSVHEPLLSTQYDAHGRQARAGLELWVGADDEAPLRCAGTRRSGAELELDGWRLEAAFFDWTMDGVEGAGSYMIWRRSP